MGQRILVAAVLLVALSAAPASSESRGRGAQPTNSCVRCHKRLVLSDPDEKFAEWQSSVHSRKGVTCDLCHGGDANAQEKKAAHRTIVSLVDPKSPIHFRNVSNTCGQCHPIQFTAFFYSGHFRGLAERERGATCVTCHGGMATIVPEPEELPAKCSMCHNERMQIWPDAPRLAQGSLEQLRNARILVERTEQLIASAPKEGKEFQRVKDLSRRSQEELARASKEWHTFNLPWVDRKVGLAQQLAMRAKELFLAAEPPSPAEE